MSFRKILAFFLIMVMVGCILVVLFNLQPAENQPVSGGASPTARNAAQICQQAVCPTCPAPAPEAAALPAPALDARPIPAPPDPQATATIYFPFIFSHFSRAYELQSGTPAYMPDYAHDYAGCNWLSVGGQVFGQSNPAETYVISVTGTLSGVNIDLMGMTGTALHFGPNGYEIPLANLPIASNGTLAIQVFDLQGQAVSDLIPFNTAAECSANVVLINFVPRQ